jgi:Short C-terminal domain
VRSGTGRGRQGPGLLGVTGRPAVMPGSSAPVSGRAPAPAAGGNPGTTDARPHDEAPRGQQRVDFRQGRWLPRHQPWNAASTGGTGRSVDELSAQLDELDRLKRAGLLTEEEFTHRRTRLLGA